MQLDDIDARGAELTKTVNDAIMAHRPWSVLAADQIVADTFRAIAGDDWEYMTKGTLCGRPQIVITGYVGLIDRK